VTDTARGVLVVGGTGVDTIVRVAELPVPLADSHVVPPIDVHVGHTGTGVALGCHRLGIPTRIVDVVGDDHEGRLVRERLAAEGIPFDAVVHPTGTRRAVNLVDPTGRRLSLYDPRHPYDLVPDAALWLDALAALDAGPGARHVHASIMPWTVHALTEATRRGLSTSTDLHDWDGENPHHRPFAEAADVVFVSGSALGGREDDVVADVLARGRAHTVVVMDGARGSRVTPREGEPFAVPALELPGRTVVDSNGAGDAYVSGFLRTWLDGGSPRDAARAGAVAGAWACGAVGTHTDLVDAAELDRQLARLAA
jgi:sugar/nucleoside kinase (ribokinase family)